MKLLALLIVAGLAAAPKRPAPLKKTWYSPRELLPVLAERDGIRWAKGEKTQPTVKTFAQLGLSRIHGEMSPENSTRAHRCLL
jgi:hypothetical protein